ncbi:hypothetical protein OGM63_17915 [Plectonema radiosum NIES-515]|uniref:Uncharacterized protein n=1 Tax=Plectonema radiosum NIES-515 TaxID=2986073 RepID=A0ABT3B1W4_9CYAN|nr:hypothetical protein [Plectonema radiosum]MCV3215366.1 hypothetical protein [Plectonema radiosum NIES-515]
MNRKFILTLLSSPVLFSSIISTVMMTNPAHASQTGNSTKTHVACVRDPHTATARMVCERVSNTPVVVKPAVKVAQVQPNQITELQFTDQESDEAIKLFGCDCPICINAVRQLHGATPMAS